jgi:hypothetical protein
LSVSNWELAKRIIGPEELSSKSPKSKTIANTKLTAMVGLVIFVLLALEGVTIPFIGPLFTLHAFIGWVLLPPILLKISSTSYRFVMYYSGNYKYVKAGPPKPLLRIIAPLIILTTALLMWSGIEMVLIGPTGPGVRMWFTIHRASFIIWFGLMAVHVLAYFLKASSFALPEFTRKQGMHTLRVPWRNLRMALVVGSVVIGIILGFSEWHLANNWMALFRNARRG